MSFLLIVSRNSPRRDQSGFALVMVVLLLFAVAVAGATGYQIVSAENELAGGGEEVQEALAIARAGLERYVGEHIGVPGASTTYVVGAGSVTITQRRLAQSDPSGVEEDSLQMWMLQAVGTMPDPRYPNSPATRTVRQYARLHNRPVRPKAAVIWNTNSLRIRNPTRVDGTSGDNDWTNNGQAYPEPAIGCAGGGSDVYATVAIGTTSTNGGGAFTDGLGLSPLNHNYTVLDAQAVKDTAQVRWSVLTDASFPIPYESNWSNPANWATDFAAIPTDSFPVIRITGDLALTSSRSGRGALIVTGNVTMGTGFTWNGIIMAGSSTDMEAASGTESTICGMLVIGLGAAAVTTNRDIRYVDVQYEEYSMAMANRSIAYFELIDGTHWEF